MPAPITWGDLAKTVEDLIKIEDRIGELIADHAALLGAHREEGEALGTHIDENPIEHPDESIPVAKIDSEAQGAGKVLTSDGAGGASWV